MAILLLRCSVSFSQVPVGDGGQSIASLPVVAPPGPNAASLGKYGDIPIGKYTGTTNVSVPLYSVSVGKFTMPISLNYFSSGLKVEELASWVGLGWSLNAGGVITRTVHNKPDEGALGYWAIGSQTDTWLDYQEDNIDANPLWKGSDDLEPDMFYFNFAGRSGKFVMDAASPHDAHTIPFQSLEIQHDNTLNGFTITDENGNQFVFDVEEKTILDASTYTSAWYLSKIITPAGVVTLSYYDDLEYTSMLNFSDADYIRFDAADAGSNQEKAEESAAISTDISSKILKQITAPGEIIKFYVSRDRLDIHLCSVLNSLTVEDNAGIIKKKFSLGHSYFGVPSTTQPKTSRLKLDNIIESSVTDQQTKVYTLDYYTPSAVPATDSKSQDYWGYYNGFFNSTLLPAVSPVDYPFITSIHDGGNRTPVFNKALSGVLKSITYPTGGNSTFIYENNDYGFVKGVPVNDDKSTQNQNNIVASAVWSTLANIQSSTKTFTLVNSQTTIVSIDGNYTGAVPREDGPEVTLNKINADNSRTQILHDALIKNSSVQYIALDAGNYEAIAKVDGMVQNASIRVDYKTPSGITLITKPCGGIRIKQIINTDPVTNKVNTTNFGYVMNDGSGRSSGDVMSEPSFVEYKSTYLVRSSYTLNYLGTTQGSNVGYKLVTESESADGHTDGKTESYYNTNPANIDGVHSTIAAHDFAHPAVPTPEGDKFVTDYDVFRGNLLREVNYNDQNIPVKETINTYNANPMTTGGDNYYELSTRKAYSFVYYNPYPDDYNQIPNQGAPLIWPHYIYYFTDAKVICPWIYKTATTERLYDPTGINYIETVNHFYYENPAHALLTKTETLNSKGETVTTINKYPQDISSGLTPTAEAARQDLVSSHTISPVLQSTTLKNNVAVNSVRTNYRIWSPGITMPENIQIQKGDNPSEQRLQYYQYDALGNILEQSKTNDVHEVYLWGYNHLYPVAKVIGSDYMTVSGTITQSILDNPTDDAALRTELNKLRTAAALKTAMVTTYTYSPLIGVTSQTDASGKTIFYAYDGFGRLENIKDQDGNIIKVFDYKYQAQ